MRRPVSIMIALMKLIQPLSYHMAFAIFLGTLSQLGAIMIPSFGAFGLVQLMKGVEYFNLQNYVLILVSISFARAAFRYGEQLANHYIAFKVLAQLRHSLLKKMEELAPAKLDNKHKGQLISTITSDVELLEVFYAHTISPIVIAILVGLVLSIFFSSYHWSLAVLAISSYTTISWLIPRMRRHQSLNIGVELREKLASISAFYLDIIRGVQDIIQFDNGPLVLHTLTEHSVASESYNYRLRKQEANNRMVNDLTILGSLLFMALLLGYLSVHGDIILFDTVFIFVVFSSTFGSFIALSMLSNNLHLTLASGQRVLDLLDERPQTSEIKDGLSLSPGDIEFESVSFKYNDNRVLDDLSLTIKHKCVTGLYGPSGEGKSTVAKLIQRFYEPNSGRILINGVDVRSIRSDSLREEVAYMSSKTDLLNTSIKENIQLGRLDASDEEVEMAAQQASLHEFIMSLPLQYHTQVHELGDRLSEGEKQRIGLARVFLSKTNIWILDEPTSNIDSLNEAVILKSLHEAKQDKTILIISHRKSTLANVDELISL